ncbi:hypothetical protein ACJJTC_007712 [Scirpophaga incertulas]
MNFQQFSTLICFTFTILLNGTGCSNDCNSDLCSNRKQNNLCKFQSYQPASHCQDHERTVQTANEKRALLERINDRRNKIASGEIRSYPSAENMVKLMWNEELTKSAQRWADQCVKQTDGIDQKDTCRDLEYAPVGQNIATVYGESPGLSPQSLVDVWYMELLNTNASVILRYSSSRNKFSHYDYFTQLAWGLSNEVGCGGVKFTERLENSKSRIVNRLVCNFAPSGNNLDEAVYSVGPPCSRCPHNSKCDKEYKSLCSQVSHYDNNMRSNEAPSDDKISSNGSEVHSEIINDDDNIYFDFLSLSLSTKQPATLPSTQSTSICRDTLAIEELVELLKKKLSNDSKLKELLQNSTNAASNEEKESSVTDPVVAFFVSKIYSKKEPTTTTKTTQSDYVNSTLLVDLIEAVLFRSSGKSNTTSDSQEITSSISDVSPIKIKAALAEIKQNDDFTGHYFIPEDTTEDTTAETLYSYDDLSSIPASYVEFEIENLRRDKTTKDFLEDIIESE